MSRENKPLDKRGTHLLFCIMGRSASGKSSLVRKYCIEHEEFSVIKSYTTREQRKEEIISGESDHIFIKDDEVDKYINEMAAYTEINGAKYFTTKDQIMKNDFYVIDPIGLNKLKEYVSKEGMDVILVPIYIYVDRSEVEKRAINRGDNIEAYLKRYESECEQFSEFEKNGMINTASYIFDNNNLSFDCAYDIFCDVIQRILEDLNTDMEK